MRRNLLIVTMLASALLFCTAAPAQAKDLSGTLGIGGARTGLHPGGLSIRYFPGPRLGFQGILRHSYEGPESVADGVDQSLNTTLLSARAIYNTIIAPDTHLYLAGGFGLGMRFCGQESTVDIPTDCRNSTEFGLDLGMGVEYFFSDFFSVSGEVGVPVRFVGDGGGVFDGVPQGFYIDAFQSLNWGMGFSFLFSNPPQPVTSNQ